MSTGADWSGDPAARSELAHWAITELADRLEAEIGRRRRPSTGTTPGRPDRIDVSAHDLAAPCAAERSVPVDDFAMSASTVAGALGRLALRERADGEPVATAVARVLAGLGYSDPGEAWFARWCTDELDRSGRAAVAAAAVRWATGTLCTVRGRSLVWAARREVYDTAGGTVRLHGNWDASDRSARPEVLLVMSGRVPGDPLAGSVAGFNALVAGALRQRMPVRVRIGSAATSTTTAYRVDREMLADTIGRVVEVVGWRIEPADAPTNPGRWCGECHLLDVCPDARRT